MRQLVFKLPVPLEGLPVPPNATADQAIKILSEYNPGIGGMALALKEMGGSVEIVEGEETTCLTTQTNQ